MREGRYRGWAAVVLAGCVLSHIVPGMYALGGAVILTVIELLPARWGIADSRLRAVAQRRDRPSPSRGARTLWWAASTVGIGLLLSGWWLVPFGLEHAYTTSMGYTNVEGWALYFREADTWALVLAGIGVRHGHPRAEPLRHHASPCSGVASALATALDPQGSLYNVRLLPLWFISVYLMAAWAFGTGCIAVAEWWRRSRARRWEATAQAAVGRRPAAARAWEEPRTPASRPGPATPTPPHAPSPRWAPGAVSGAVLGLLAVMAIVAPPFVFQPSSAGARRDPTRSRTGPTSTTRGTRASPPIPSTAP